MNKKYQSVAIWPDDSGIYNIYGENKSTDKHYTHDEAQGVCNLLMADGFGGDGEIFPVRCYVEKVKE